MSLQYGLISPKQFPAFRPLLPDGPKNLNDPGLYAVGAVQDNIACGVLVFRADNLIADIQYLAVAEGYRGQGIANGLIDFLCAAAWKETVAVMGSFSAPDWDEPICQLLMKRGDFTIQQTEDYICRFSCKVLEKVNMNVKPPAGNRIAPFYALEEQLRRSFFTKMKEDNSEFAAGVQEARALMLDPLCLCMVDSREAVTAAIFCQNDGGNVSLLLAYALPGHARALMALVSRLRELLVQASEKVPYLKIAAVTPESRKLVDTLLPEREITAHFYVVSWDMNTLGGP